MKAEAALNGLYKKIRTIDEAYKPNGITDNRGRMNTIRLFRYMFGYSDELVLEIDNFDFTKGDEL